MKITNLITFLDLESKSPRGRTKLQINEMSLLHNSKNMNYYISFNENLTTKKYGKIGVLHNKIYIHFNDESGITVKKSNGKSKRLTMTNKELVVLIIKLQGLKLATVVKDVFKIEEVEENLITIL